MHITFQTLEIINFLSFTHEIFDFNQPYGLALITGRNNDLSGASNGVGKSSLFNALLYTLFGRMQYNVKIQNLKNKFASPDATMALSLNFLIDDKAYRITRGLEKGRYSFVKLEVEADKEDQEQQQQEQEEQEEEQEEQEEEQKKSSTTTGSTPIKYIDITQSSILATDQYIAENVLNCDIDLFLRTTFLTTDSVYNFFNLRPFEKKEFFKTTFDTRIYADIYTRIHRDILDTEKEKTYLSNEIVNTLSQIEIFKDKQKKYIEKLNSNNQQLDNEIQKYELEVQKLQEKLNIIQTTRSGKTNNLPILEFLTNSKNICTVKQTQLRTEKEKLNKQLLTLEKNKIKIESKISHNNQFLEKNNILIGKFCDKCKPIIESEFNITTIQKDNLNYIEQAKTTNEEIFKISEKLKTITEEDETKLAESLDKINRHIESYNKQLSEISNQLHFAKNNYNFYLEKKKEQTQKQAESDTYTDVIQTFEDNNIKIQRKIDAINNLNNYLLLAENAVSDSTIKKYLIADLISLLNSKIKYFLNIFSITNFCCVFDTDFNYKIYNEKGEYEYNNLSGGEKMRLLLATTFAFRFFMEKKYKFTTNCLIIDEYIDSALDTRALENILTILSPMVSTNPIKNIFVVTHRAAEINPEQFDTNIIIEKTNNISTIMYNKEK